MIKKNLFTFCLSLAFVCLGLVSCSKDSEKSNPVGTSVLTPDVEEAIANKVTCTMSGAISSFFTSFATVPQSISNGFSFVATSMNSTSISLKIKNLSETGKNYSITSTASSEAQIEVFVATSGGYKGFNLVSGSIKVTEITNKYIKGTFSGETLAEPASDYLKITDGTFVCKR